MHANKFGPKETVESPDEVLKGSYRLVLVGKYDDPERHLFRASAYPTVQITFSTHDSFQQMASFFKTFGFKTTQEARNYFMRFVLLEEWLTQRSTVR
jgi:hypothetical protein